MTAQRKYYVLALVLLLCLTATTVGVAEIDLGEVNTLAAVGIAALKVSIVGWFFMHLRAAPGLVRLIAASGLFWLLLLLGLTFADYATRIGALIGP
jgi:cytochrome c oxidase subunit IV